MGNKSTKTEGSVFVKTEKPFYISGEQVNGTVYLDIKKGMEGHQLVVKIKGKEFASWNSSKNKENSQNVLFCHKFVLHDWHNGLVPPSQCMFPFMFVLPPYVPGSFSEVSKKYNCGIKYKVKAEIVSILHGKQHSVLDHSQELVIREPIKNALVPLFGEKDHHMKYCCCLNGGHSKIKCYFEKNFYQPGDQANIVTEIDNSRSKADITKVTAKLVQKLVLYSNKGEEFVKEKDIVVQDFQGVNKGCVAISESRMINPIQLRDKKGGGITPSTKGKLVQSSFTLRIQAHYRGSWCSKSVSEIIVPISIVSPPPLNFGVVEQPQNWNPQQYGISTFQLDKQFMYDSKQSVESANSYYSGQSQQQQLMQQSQQPQYPQQQGYPQDPQYGGQQGYPVDPQQQYQQQQQYPQQQGQQQQQYAPYQQPYIFNAEFTITNDQQDNTSYHYPQD